MPEYYAHSENSRNEKHRLSKHLHQTARFVESFACHDIYKTIFKITGLLHDLGKYQPEFQSYLANGGKRGSVPHASWGAGYARILKVLEASIAIDGHHKGLPDKSTWKSDTEPFKRGEVSEFEKIKQEFINDTGVNEGDIEKIISRSAEILGLNINKNAMPLIARSSRSTPRIANRLLKRVRDFAQIYEKPIVTSDIVASALKLLEIDELGLEPSDKHILRVIIDKYNGGPVGIQTLAASTSEETETIEDVHEPYLLRLGFIIV